MPRLGARARSGYCQEPKLWVRFVTHSDLHGGTMTLLNDDEIGAGLPEGWAHEGNEVKKEFAFDTFPTAIAFVNLLADAAEDANHHPDIDIRYNRVLVALSTHSEGGVTEKDLSLAGRAEQLAGAASGGSG